MPIFHRIFRQFELCLFIYPHSYQKVLKQTKKTDFGFVNRQNRTEQQKHTKKIEIQMDDTRQQKRNYTENLKCIFPTEFSSFSCISALFLYANQRKLH